MSESWLEEETEAKATSDVKGSGGTDAKQGESKGDHNHFQSDEQFLGPLRHAIQQGHVRKVQRMVERSKMSVAFTKLMFTARASEGKAICTILCKRYPITVADLQDLLTNAIFASRWRNKHLIAPEQVVRIALQHAEAAVLCHADVWSTALVHDRCVGELCAVAVERSLAAAASETLSEAGLLPPATVGRAWSLLFELPHSEPTARAAIGRAALRGMKPKQLEELLQSCCEHALKADNPVLCPLLSEEKTRTHHCLFATMAAVLDAGGSPDCIRATFDKAARQNPGRSPPPFVERCCPRLLQLCLERVGGMSEHILLADSMHRSALHAATARYCTELDRTLALLIKHLPRGVAPAEALNRVSLHGQTPLLELLCRYAGDAGREIKPAALVLLRAGATIDALPMPLARQSPLLGLCSVDPAAASASASAAGERKQGDKQQKSVLPLALGEWHHNRVLLNTGRRCEQLAEEWESGNEHSSWMRLQAPTTVQYTAPMRDKLLTPKYDWQLTDDTLPATQQRICGIFECRAPSAMQALFTSKAQLGTTRNRTGFFWKGVLALVELGASLDDTLLINVSRGYRFCTLRGFLEARAGKPETHLGRALVFSFRPRLFGDEAKQVLARLVAASAERRSMVAAELEQLGALIAVRGSKSESKDADKAAASARALSLTSENDDASREAEAASLALMLAVRGLRSLIAEYFC